MNSLQPSVSIVTVEQETVLGPLLFLCFINVPQCISSKIRLYADNVLLYREIETTEDCIKLQMDLDALQNWEIHGKYTLIHAS